MESSAEFIKHLNRIRIHVRSLSAEFLSGMYHSAFKGRGIHFAEVREYVYGDEIKNIDWNVTARFNQPFVKVFEEEREMTFMVVADVSGSVGWNARGMRRRDMMAYISGCVLYSAFLNNDRMGALLFAREPVKFIPPAKGINHFMSIMRDILVMKGEGPTNILLSLQSLYNFLKKKSIILFISDFLDSRIGRDRESESTFRIVGRRHYLRVVFLYDEGEYEAPPGGILPVRDIETGETIWVDFSSRKNREMFARKMQEHKNRVIDLLRRTGVDFVVQSTGAPFLQNLIYLFSK